MSGALRGAWRRLGIEPTTDQGAIRRAYADALRAMDVDADVAGFAALRDARDTVLAWARQQPKDAAREAPEPESPAPCGRARVRAGHLAHAAPRHLALPRSGWMARAWWPARTMATMRWCRLRSLFRRKARPMRSSWWRGRHWGQRSCRRASNRSRLRRWPLRVGMGRAPIMRCMCAA
jgi:hypothetical protein